MTLLSAAVNAVNDIGINLQDILEQEATSFLPILSEPTGGMLRNKTTAYLKSGHADECVTTTPEA